MKKIFKNKYGQIRSGWKIGGTMAGFFGVVTLASIPLSIILMIYLVASGLLSSEMVSDSKAVNEFIMGGPFRNSFMILQEVVMIAVPLIVWKYFEKKSFEDMGFGHIKNNKKDLIIGLLFGAASMTIVFAVIVLTGNAELSYSLLNPKFSTGLLTSLFLFILVGFGEEILGRGYIMTVLKQTNNIVAIMIISAILFSAMHINNPNVSVVGLINIVLVGVLFSYMYIKSGSIWMPIGYHITWNYFQGNIFGFKVSGLNQVGLYKTNVLTANSVNGGDFGPEGGIVATIIIIIGLLFVAWYYRNSEYEFLPKKENECGKIEKTQDN